MESALCSASIQNPSPCWRDSVVDPSVALGRPSSHFLAPSPEGRNRKQEEEEVRRKRRSS
jgi:hypothetical protein